jgi:hypothetical protein
VTLLEQLAVLVDLIGPPIVDYTDPLLKVGRSVRAATSLHYTRMNQIPPGRDRVVRGAAAACFRRLLFPAWQGAERRGLTRDVLSDPSGWAGRGKTSC